MAVSDQSSRTPTRCLHAALDAAAYSTRTSLRQRDLQDRLQAVLSRAMEAIGFDLDALWLQPQGDGALIRFPADIDETAAVAGLIRELHVELTTLNSELIPAAWLRLRLALHVGLSHGAALGLAGDALVVVSRLVNSPQLRDLLKRSEHAPLVVIAAESVYQDLVVQRFRGLDPDDWVSADVVDDAKGFAARAWMTVPGKPSGPPPAGHAPAGTRQGPPALFGSVESVEKLSVINGPVHIESGGFTIN